MTAAKRRDRCCTTGRTDAVECARAAESTTPVPVPPVWYDSAGRLAGNTERKEEPQATTQCVYA